MGMHAHAYGPGSFAAVLLMWSVMMVVMMAPSATPLVLTYRGLERARARGAAQSVAVSSGALLAGYLVVWLGFSLGAAVLQVVLQRASLMAPGAERAVPLLAGVLLVLAGVWQLTPLKHACLTRCRSPMDFLMTQWRDGARGALAMGVRHGAWCVGCCWALMLLLFVGGVMNLLWIAGLAGWVLLEKTMPRAPWLARAAGVVAIGWGAALLAAATRG